MELQNSQIGKVCEKLKALGYAQRNRIRMYGEEFELVSNPVPHENGFAIEAISRKSGSARQLRIPLSILRMIAKDLEASTRPAQAA